MGFEYAQAFEMALSVDYHEAERLIKAGATPAQTATLLLP